MEEVWKDVAGYEGLYQVSNMGRVRSLDRKIKGFDGRTFFHKGKILKASLNIKRGYLRVRLTKHNKGKFYRVHRLVAKTFVPNPHNLKEVNHIDENRLNNVATNLEWCSSYYNNHYGTRTIRAAESAKKPVAQLGQNGQVIKTFPSAVDAERITGISRKRIQAVASHYLNDGKYLISRAGGYKWEYVRNITNN